MYCSKFLPANIVLPRAFVVRVFSPSGDLRTPYWDDPDLVAANPTLSLPHQRIFLALRSGSSGTTQNFKTGLKIIAAKENVAYAGDTNQTPTWNLNSQDYATFSSPALIAAFVAATPYSLAFLPSDIDSEGLYDAGIINMKSGGVVSRSSDPAHVLAAADLAIVDNSLNVFLLDISPETSGGSIGSI